MATLSSEKSGPPDAPRLVLAHGFTQSARCWDPVDADLRTDHEVVAVDLPGHGSSAAAVGDLPTAGAWLIEAGGAGVYVGYSMGGRIALHAALAAPQLVRGLVLISATPGLAHEGERAARRAADDALAAHLEQVGLPAFVDEWLALPLFAGLPAARSHRDERLRNTVAGLASSLRTEGTGTQEPLWDRLDELAMPVLLVTGGHDAKFTGIAEHMLAGLPDARHVVVTDAGHTVHLEQPEQFLVVLRAWLAELGA